MIHLRHSLNPNSRKKWISVVGGRDVTLRFSVLASGSTGNAFYIESDKQKLLVDAGLSGSQRKGYSRKIQGDRKQLPANLLRLEHGILIKDLGIFLCNSN